MTTSALECGEYGKSKVDFDALAVSLLVNLLGLGIPLAMLQIFDRVLPNESLPTLDAIFVVMLSVVAADTLLKIMRGRIVLANGISAERSLSHRLIDRLFAGDLKALRAMGPDTVLERLQAPGRLRVLLSGQAMLAKVDLAFSLVFLSIIFVLGGILVAVPAAAIGYVLLVARLVRPAHRHAVRVRETNAISRMSLLRDVLNRARTLKLLTGETRLLSRYAALQDKASSAQCTLARVSDVAFTTSAMAGQVTTGALSLVGGYLVIVGGTDLASLAACIMLAGRSVQPFLQAFLADGDLGQAHETARSLNAFLSIEDAPRPGLALRDRDLAIDAKSLRWSTAAPTAGDDALTFSVDPGTLVTIGGDRGDVASRILQILAGNRPAEGGDVKVFGRRIRFGTKGTDGPTTMFVPRHPVLFNGTVRQNLAAYRDNLADGQFVSGLLDVHTEIDMLPDGIDWQHEGANRGGGSQGLRKKIALAASLASDADLLLIDTPGAGLDPVSRRLLNEHLVMTKGLATVVVANADPDLVERSDLHIELIEGVPPRLSRPAETEALDEADMIWLATEADADDDRMVS